MGFDKKFNLNDNYFLLEINNEIEDFLNKNKKIEFKNYNDNNLYFISNDKCYKVIRNVYSNSFTISNEKHFLGFTNDKIYFNEIKPDYDLINIKLNQITKKQILEENFLNLENILNDFLISKNQLINLIKSQNGIVDKNENIIYLNIKNYYNDIINFYIYLRVNNFDQTSLDINEINKHDNFELNIILLNINTILEDCNNGFFKIKISILLECLILKLFDKSEEYYYHEVLEYLNNEIHKILEVIIISEIKNLNFLIFKILCKYGIRINKEEYNENYNKKKVIYKKLEDLNQNPKKRLIQISSSKDSFTKEEIEIYFKNLFDKEEDYEKFFKRFFKKCFIKIDNKYIDKYKNNYIENEIEENLNEFIIFKVKKI